MDVDGATPNLTETTVLLSVQTRIIGTYKAVPTSLVEIAADKKLIHVSSQLYDSKELRNIFKLDNARTEFLKSRCLPSLFRSGTYLLPIACVAEVEDYLEAYLIKRKAAVAKFVEVYDKVREDSIKRLGVAACPDKYPPTSQVENYFTVDIRYLTFETPEKLREVSPGLYKKQMEKAQRDVAEVAEEAKVVLRSTLADLTAQLAEKLGPAADGKRKALRTNAFDRLNDFLKVFDSRNVCSDASLKTMVDQLRSVMKGTDVTIVKSDVELKAKMAENLATVACQLKDMVVEQKTRRLERGV